MKYVNSNFSSLRCDYLFPLINLKVSQYKASHKGAQIINLGEANPSRPLCPAASAAIKNAIDEPAHQTDCTPSCGFDFMRQSVCRHYAKRGVDLCTDEVFVGNGIKDDISNITDIFGSGKTVLIPDPVYPVYMDTSIMAGYNIVLIQSGGVDCLPAPNYDIHADIIYISSPCNPTGTAYFTEDLRAWVAYALDNNAVLLFDAAFAAFIRDENLVRSIYEIEGAKSCAIEFASCSDFSGLGCGCTVIPNELKCGSVELNALWRRRQQTKFGGVPYIIQRGAEAILSDEGQRQIKEIIDYYMENARIMKECLHSLGIWCCGGNNSPFLWMKCPGNLSSWEFFRLLLEKTEIVIIPGSGFGIGGEGYMRISSFADRQVIYEAMDKFAQFLKYCEKYFL